MPPTAHERKPRPSFQELLGDASKQSRPLAASEAQVAAVTKLRKAGKSLRAIANETNLSLPMVSELGRQAPTASPAERRCSPQAAAPKA
jgi:hypothetical protein